MTVTTIFKCLCVAICLVTTALAAERPNILYILADDLGYGDVHAMDPARGKIPTPNLDRLAQEGRMFTDAHSGSSVCTPTRYGILTGRYAWRTSLQSGVLFGYGPPIIAEGRSTVAELLRNHGYHTSCIGKWHLGIDWPKLEAPPEDRRLPGWEFDFSKPFRRGPLDCGFDYFFGISASLDMPPFAYLENNRLTELPTVTKKWIREGRAAPSFEAVDVLPDLTRRTAEVIGERASDAKAGKPFFIYLALTSPHTPIEPTPEWQGRSGLNAYADFVMQTDAAVGNLLNALESHGLTKDTLVIFTSDNGCSPEANISLLEKAGHFPNSHFRGMKSDIWEGGHRVPMIARWPGRISPGSKSANLVCLTDLMATAAELCGAKLADSQGEDSFSMLPALVDSGVAARTSVVHHSINGQFAIRDGEWKLVFCPGSGGWSSPGDVDARRAALPAVQLYNLAKDPGEITNLQNERPEIVARLSELMDEISRSGRSTPGEPQLNDIMVNFRIQRP
jgi:arylsulfatase A